MIIRFLRYLLDSCQRLRSSPTSSAAVTQALTDQTQTQRLDSEINALRQQIAASRVDCRLLGEALHEGGLEAFAETLCMLAQQYGMSLSTQDFKAHLYRQQQLHQRRPAAYLVQFCRGGGLH